MELAMARPSSWLWPWPQLRNFMAPATWLIPTELIATLAMQKAPTTIQEKHKVQGMEVKSGMIRLIDQVKVTAETYSMVTIDTTHPYSSKTLMHCIYTRD
jgi:hypothetical protein